jgi:peptide/nickel transport system permease protein
VLLLVMVFFLFRLTGDPAALFLPIDASQGMIDQFRELHGLKAPCSSSSAAMSGKCCTSISATACVRRARRSTWCSKPRLDAVARIDHHLPVTAAAIVIGSIAAFRPGGIFDQLVTFISLIGASAPDFRIATSAGSTEGIGERRQRSGRSAEQRAPNGLLRRAARGRRSLPTYFPLSSRA